MLENENLENLNETNETVEANQQTGNETIEETSQEQQDDNNIKNENVASGVESNFQTIIDFLSNEINETINNALKSVELPTTSKENNELVVEQAKEETCCKIVN